MGKSLKELSKSGIKKNPESKPVISGQDAEGINGLINKYAGKDDNELMRELLKVTDEQKRNGSFDRTSIDEAAESILPMLNDEQAKKLHRILNAIK